MIGSHARASLTRPTHTWHTTGLPAGHPSADRRDPAQGRVTALSWFRGRSVGHPRHPLGCGSGPLSAVTEGHEVRPRVPPHPGDAAGLVRAQIARVAELHEQDRAAGHGWAALPGALHRKDPTAGYELGWQWLFPARSVGADPATDRTGRPPLHATAVQRALKPAVRRSGIPKRATCHTFRHSFATEALRGGCDLRTLQHVMGHRDIRTTTIYLRVVEQTGPVRMAA
jgi:hypothetical protein